MLKSTTLSGRSLFALSWRLTLLAGCVALLLQMAFFFRPTPYGNPYVAHWDRFFFHAVFYDTMTLLVLMLPFFATWYVTYHRPLSRVLGMGLLLLQSLLLTTNTLLNHVDHEVMRFMGTHLSLSFIATYASLSGSQATIGYALSSDLGGTSIPAGLLLLPVGFLVVASFSVLRLRERPYRKLRWMPAVWAILPLTVLLIVHSTPGGRFRIAKVQPIAMTWWKEILSGIKGPQPPNSEAALIDHYQQQWLAAHPEGGWQFTDPQRPFVRAPLATSPAITPYNIVFLQLESFRAWDMGLYRPDLPHPSPTPFLDALARAPNSAYWIRHFSFGPPTIAGFFALNASITPHSNRNMTTEFTFVRFLSLAEVLRRHGYRAELFTGSDPDWDNQRYWLLRWYDTYQFIRDANEHDRIVFARAATRLHELGQQPQPFFVCITSISNHYPFHSKDPSTDMVSSTDPKQNIRNTMHYTDVVIRDFFAAIHDEPWFTNTIFVITGDHAYNLGEHDQMPGQRNLYHESTWVPLIISGLPPDGPSGPQHQVAALIDIAPTLTDLIGIRTPVPWHGMSLLTPRPRTLTYVHGDMVLSESPDFSLVREAATGSIALFSAQDLLQQTNLLSSRRDTAKTLLKEATGFNSLNNYVIETDRVWP